MSVDKWQKLRRNQQELVLAVWDRVLEQIKWEVAKEGGSKNFGTNLHGLYGPKELPFDIALEALKELAGGTPKYKHGCPGCVFLGHYDSCIRADGTPMEKDTTFDLYWCNQGGGVKKNAYTARFGTKSDSIRNTSDLWDPDKAAEIDEDPQLTSKDHPDHPAIKEAKRRAAERGLFIEPMENLERDGKDPPPAA